MTYSTDFQSGTTITHQWLNAVDGVVFQVTNQTATQGQTLFSVPLYPLGGSLMVFRNGLMQQYGVDYSETDTAHITFASGLTAGDTVTTRG